MTNVKSLPTITTHLLTLPRLGNPYLSQSAYSILSEMLTTPSDEAEGDISSQVSNVLKAVLSSLPSKADATLAPAWLVVLGNAMVVYSGSDPEGCAAEVGKVWKVVWTFLESGDTATRRAAAQSLDMLAQCFTPRLISTATSEAAQLATDAEPKSALGRIVAQTTKALDSLALARSVPEVLTAISSLIDNLRYSGDGASTGPTAAEVIMLPLIEKVSVLRVQKSFEYKEGADGVMSMAMAVLGPAVLLERLPLNLEPADRYVPSLYLVVFTLMHHVLSAAKPVVNLELSFSLCCRNRTRPLLATSCPTLCHSASACLSISQLPRWRIDSLRPKYGVCSSLRSGQALSAIATTRPIYRRYARYLFQLPFEQLTHLCAAGFDGGVLPAAFSTPL